MHWQPVAGPGDLDRIPYGYYRDPNTGQLRALPSWAISQFNGGDAKSLLRKVIYHEIRGAKVLLRAALGRDEGPRQRQHTPRMQDVMLPADTQLGQLQRAMAFGSLPQGPH